MLFLNAILLRGLEAPESRNWRVEVPTRKLEIMMNRSRPPGYCRKGPICGRLWILSSAQSNGNHLWFYEVSIQASSMIANTKTAMFRAS